MAQEKAANIIDLNAPREAPGPDEMQSAGDFLAASRRAAGASLATVSTATNVKIEHLEAIEATNATALPAVVYAVGFVKVYAQFLGLDVESVVKQFKSDIGADASVAVAPVNDPVAPSSPHISDGARMVSIFGILAILIFVFWTIVQITGNPGDNRPVQTAATERSVRLGAAPVSAPELRPQNTVPATVTVSRPVVETPMAEKKPELSGPSPKISQTPEVISSSLNHEVQADDAMDGGAVAAPEISEEVVRSPELTPNEENTDISTVLVAAPVAELPPAQATLRAEPLIEPDRAPVPLIVDAKLTRSIAPRYPHQCTRNAAPQESVTILFDVSIRGRAANARVIQTSNACFDRAAMATIRRWRFDPKTVDGVLRPDIGKQATLNFRR